MTLLPPHLWRQKNAITEQLMAAGQQAYLDAATLMRLYHGRGNDERVHRHLKEFSPEQPPFKRFSMNQAFHYVMLVAWHSSRRSRKTSAKVWFR
jgi:hypothetical protein